MDVGPFSRMPKVRICNRKIIETSVILSHLLCSDIFTVGGMNKGTCGAYVNEHGVIHQTTTLRTASRSNIFLQGHSETKDR